MWILTRFHFSVINHFSGQYVFIESSFPRKRGDKADLKSVQFDPTGPRCLNFWFNVHGANMGTLRVMIAPSNNTALKTTIWQVYGQDFGTAWQQGKVTFSNKVPFNVSTCICFLHYKMNFTGECYLIQLNTI